MRHYNGYKVTQKFVFTMQQYRKMAEQGLSKTGIHRGQHHLLMYLAHHPDTSQTDIANCLKVSTATIAVAVKKLEKGGYINRVIDGKDNRFNKVMLTDKGQQVVEQSKVIMESLEAKMYEGFSEEEVLQLTNYLERIYKNLGTAMEGKASSIVNEADDNES